jgi:hypothetical protein
MYLNLRSTTNQLYSALRDLIMAYCAPQMSVILSHAVYQRIIMANTYRGVNVGGCGGVVHPPREMIQSVSN